MPPSVTLPRARQLFALCNARICCPCSTPVEISDIDGAEFTEYTPEANAALVNAAYDQTPFLADATAQDRDETAAHPQTSVCVPARRRSARH